MKLPSHKLITTQSDWQLCLEELQAESRLAIDLEANSMYAYREEICLIQITIPGKDYIIDPLGVPDPSGLGAIIALFIWIASDLPGGIQGIISSYIIFTI